MKTRLYGFAALLLAAVLFLTGCPGGHMLAGMNSGSTDNGNSTKVEFKMFALVDPRTEAELETKIVLDDDSARTLLPSGLATAATAVDLYVTGKSHHGKTLDIVKVSLSSGSFTVKIEPDQWDMELYAVKKGSTFSPLNDTNVRAKALLYAHDTFDFTTAAGEVPAFTLTPDIPSSPDGFVNLNVVLKAWPEYQNVTTMSVGIYDVLQKETEVKHTDASTSIETSGDISGTTGGNDFTFEYGGNGATKGFKPGTYQIIAKISTSITENGAPLVLEASDTIHIFPGQDTDAAFVIPNLIQSAPAAPEDFEASYKNLDLPSKKGWYTLVFDWKDKSKNEEYFEIEMAEVEGATADDVQVTAGTFAWDIYSSYAASASVGGSTASAASGDTDEMVKLADGTSVSKAQTKDYNATWDGKVFFYDNKVKDNSNTRYVDGALNANSKHLELNVKLGKIYAARIRAVNKYGKSAWVNVVVGADKGTAEGKFTTYISQYRLTYYLQGGQYTASTKTVKEDKVEYGEYSGAGKALWTEASLEKYEKRNDLNYKYTFDKWYTDVSTSSAAATPYTGYSNNFYFAGYTWVNPAADTGGSNPGIDQGITDRLSGTEVAIKALDAGGSEISPPAAFTNYAYTADVSKIKTLQFTVTTAHPYEEIRLKREGTVIGHWINQAAVQLTPSINWVVTDYEKKVYPIVLEVLSDSGNIFSWTYYIYLEDSTTD